ncbi:MAG: hypothetical protein HYY06_31855 [Deltaproteobacteria bacterium]|nr:hypothetical protein [Deltaproteobacteria bacterium]
MRPGLVSLLVLATAAIPCRSGAQPMPPNGGEASWEDVRLVEGGAFRVRTQWSGSPSDRPPTSTITCSRLGPDLVATGEPLELHRGPTVVPAIAARADGTSAVVVLVHEGAEPFVKVAVVELRAGAQGSPRVRRVVAAPRGNSRYSPSWAVAAADPDGFTILWQEISATDPTDARTMLSRIRPDGTWIAEPRAVAVPWATAAIAWNGEGYLLALYFGGFGGQSSGGIRLCFVTLSADGRPGEHPWWASPEERIGEVQLLPSRDGIAAFWRGGAGGTELRSTISNGVGQWGREPRAPTSHGRIEEAEAFALRLDASGRVEAVRLPASR